MDYAVNLRLIMSKTAFNKSYFNTAVETAPQQMTFCGDNGCCQFQSPGSFMYPLLPAGGVR